MPGPVVGDPPEYDLPDDAVPWVLGTHLHTGVGPLSRAPEGSTVLVVEAHDFARRMPYHAAKLTLVFAAMRRFRDRLREAGYDVHYVRADTFGDGVEQFFEVRPGATLVTMRPPSYGAADGLRELVAAAGGDLRVVENEGFLCTRAAFDEWADGREFEHEAFYRWMRRESGVLMDDGDPVGGEWNYDEDNRDVPPDDWTAPRVPDADHGETTAAVREWVDEAFDAWGNTEEFVWPVTREGALAWLDAFVADRLPEFGPYQDAMVRGEWAMAHALLSPAINLGLLHPREVVEAVESAYHDRSDVPLNSAEGLIRQVLGWREFVRGVYRHEMPDLADANRLDATRDLPELYWTGDTEMACLAETVGDVRKRGYSHHIQRLMVLSNFATLWGVDPAQLNEWFHAAYVDAYHWVTTPNVVEMGSYAGGSFATKPYVSSANYVDRMSDYCAGCPYDPDETVGEDACPFNALYWDFLDRHEDRLRSNHRMALVYGHLDDKREGSELAAIRDRVADLRDREADGSL
ncbi:cryptochrome/photolyase family protein [Halobacteriales archaeon QS_8_69_26]|nr:MAG: cryptochrome/photolyase family protein [Halobacteriales archaeon QS_8_69_26]